MLRWRLIIGTGVVAALFVLGWLDAHLWPPGAVLFPVAVILATAAVGELLAMWADRPTRPIRWVVYFGTLAIVCSAGVPLFGLSAVLGDEPSTELGDAGWPLVGLSLGLLAAAGGELKSYRGEPGRTEAFGLAVFAMSYVGLPMAWMVVLRNMNGPDWGLLALLSLVVTVKLADVGAYAVGRLLGRHKLVPRISPGKTWEGLAGGMVFAVGGAVFSIALLPGWMGLDSPDAAAAGDWLSWGVYGILLALAGLVGDLTISLLKRDANRKDSSTWMPGMGGVLDILDSLLIGAPVAYFCWALKLVGP